MPSGSQATDADSMPLQMDPNDTPVISSVLY